MTSKLIVGKRPNEIQPDFVEDFRRALFRREPLSEFYSTNASVKEYQDGKTKIGMERYAIRVVEDGEEVGHRIFEAELLLDLSPDAPPNLSVHVNGMVPVSERIEVMWEDMGEAKRILEGENLGVIYGMEPQRIVQVYSDEGSLSFNGVHFIEMPEESINKKLVAVDSKPPQPQVEKPQSSKRKLPLEFDDVIYMTRKTSTALYQDMTKNDVKRDSITPEYVNGYLSRMFATDRQREKAKIRLASWVEYGDLPEVEISTRELAEAVEKTSSAVYQYFRLDSVSVIKPWMAYAYIKEVSSNQKRSAENLRKLIESKTHQ